VATPCTPYCYTTLVRNDEVTARALNCPHRLTSKLRQNKRKASVDFDLLAVDADGGTLRPDLQLRVEPDD